MKFSENTSIKQLKFLVLMSLVEMENIGVKAIVRKLLKLEQSHTSKFGKIGQEKQEVAWLGKK